MPVHTISQTLSELVVQAVDRAGHAGILETSEPAVPTQNPRFGDYQSNHAFRLGKAMRTNPRQVAETVVEQLGEHSAIEKAEVAGPGFVNFTLRDDWVADRVREQVTDPHGGIPQSGHGRTMVIDYSSPNVAKRMHVGHMRSTLIGHAIDRIHRAAGWTVVADNHIGDWGTQYGKLMVAWRRWLDEQRFDDDPLGELERLYVKFGQEASDKDMDLARAETARLQAGDPEVIDLWKRFISVSLTEFDKVYARLGVNFDVTLGESFYNDQLPETVQDYIESGIATESDGAIIIKFGPEDGKGLDDTVLVIRKNDGAFLYGTTDLATLRHRRDTWKPQRIVYVTDKRQQLHFRQVFRAWTRQASEVDQELVHVWFGTLNLPGGAMSSRSGNIIRLAEFMDEGVRRARAVVDEKSPQLSEDERARVAEAVGCGAIRYADLSQNPQSDVNFDFDRTLSLEGNTAPYLMYSYARCRSLQRKGGVQSPSVDALAAREPVERALLLRLARFPEAVQTSLENHRPNILCEALFETANAFNRFYKEVRVLGAEDPVVKAERLALVEASARVLARGLDILGIRALERM